MKQSTNPRHLAAAVVAALGLGAALAASTTEADVAISRPLEKAAFPHTVHVEDHEIACGACHAAAARPEEEVGAPSPESCEDCHEPSDVARYFPLGSYHRQDFVETHAHEARLGGGSCTTCHTDSETCAMCHHGENLDLLSHPRNWLFLHSIEARHRQADCAACHSTEQFCTACHAQEQVVPSAHRAPGWGRGVVHGSEARRDPEYCASCHAGAEPVCLDCHARR